MFKNIIFDVVVVIIALYVIYDAVSSYIAATGTVWQRFLVVGKQSATILWSRALIVFGAMIDILSQLADFLGAPGVSTSLQQYLDAKTLAAIMIGTAVMTEYARRRTLRHATDANNNIVK